MCVLCMLGFREGGGERTLRCDVHGVRMHQDGTSTSTLYFHVVPAQHHQALTIYFVLDFVIFRRFLQVLLFLHVSCRYGFFSFQLDGCRKTHVYLCLLRDGTNQKQNINYMGIF